MTRDDPNHRYWKMADVEHWSGHFRREGRDVWERRASLLDAMQLRPGMTVMDVGAGTGAFSELVLDRVGVRGRVHAIEIVDHFVQRLSQLAIVHPSLRVWHSADEVPAQSVDLAICIDTYHHLEEPSRVMGAVARALVPGGKLLLVDLHVDARSPAELRAHVRADRDTVTRELTAVGFVLERRLPDLAENHASVFSHP